MKLLSTKLFLTTVVILSFASCIKDVGKRSYQVYSPNIESMSVVRAKIKSTSPVAVTNAGKLFMLGNYIFLNEKNKGIHIIDNTNPANPQNVSFINIPGNIDVAVKDNILYADCYNDLVVIDISTPSNIILKNFIEDVFPDRRNTNGFTTPVGSVVTSWNVKDTSMDIEIGEGQGIWTKNGYVANGFVGGGILLSGGTPTSLSTGGTTGKAGSMSRFALMNNYLYSVTTSTLNCINISNASMPVITTKQNIGWNIETIYPFKDKLFIGSQTGMQIFNVTNASQPNYISGFSHARLCDPVIADDNYAYITLHSGTSICQGTQNELDVVDITNISSPVLLKRIDLTKPQGLSKDGNVLFVCDDDAGIRVFDASNPKEPVLKQTLTLSASYDVICNNGIAVVSAKDGIHQYDYHNINNIVKLGKFSY